jgi:hypothetical protein
MNRLPVSIGHSGQAGTASFLRNPKGLADLKTSTSVDGVVFQHPPSTNPHSRKETARKSSYRASLIASSIRSISPHDGGTSRFLKVSDMTTTLYSTVCDSILASLDVWSPSKNDIMVSIDRVGQRTRSRDKGLDDSLEFCLTADCINKKRVIRNGILVDNIWQTDYCTPNCLTISISIHMFA